MSDKLKNSEMIDRPFAPGVMTKAKKLADKYQIVLTQEDGEWFGHALEMTTVFADGKTPAGCIRKIRQALASAVATMLEMGETPPAQARLGIRSEQINIRLTTEEKTVLETTAKQKGFRGLSDFVRAGAIAFAK